MPRWTRQILFGDVDAMYASSAIAANPSLEGKLVAVGSPPPRGIITAASYSVRRFGVTAAMPTAHALRLCPDLLLIPPDRPLYQRLHNRMREVTDRFFPATEWTSIDEFYADTTDLQSLHPHPAVLGQAVKQAILEATGLRCTIAVASGKTVAKIAADGHKPDGLAVIEPGNAAAFLAPRPVCVVPGIGPKTAEALDAIGLRVIGDLLDPRFARALHRLLGTRLPALQELAQGVDADPVRSDRHQKSIGHETTFDRDTNEAHVLEDIVQDFLGELTHDLRIEGLAAGSFTVKLKDAQFRVTTRQRRFSQPQNYDPAMWPAIQSVLNELIAPGANYRLVGLSLSDLTPATEGLFDRRRDKAVATLDELIEKHGAKVMGLGGLRKESPG